MVPLVRHRQTKGPDTDRQNLNHRATSRLYTLRYQLLPHRRRELSKIRDALGRVHGSVHAGAARTRKIY